MGKEICNECGKSVQFGFGHFVNRVPDFNDLNERIEMQKPFPDGDFICQECDEQLNSEVNAESEGITN